MVEFPPDDPLTAELAAAIEAETAALRGRQAAARGQLAEAARLYEEALERHPRSAKAELLLRETRFRLELERALAALAAGDGARAAEHARRAAELRPDRPQGHVLLGRAHLLRGNTRGAEEAFRATLERNPAHALALHGLGALYEERGRAERDPDLLQEGLRLGERARALGSAGRP